MENIIINGIERQFDGELHSTTNYDELKMLLGNRFINQKYVEDLRKSMEMIGILPMPIIVNEKMEIIDGQHREAAIERLGGTVYYIIVPGLTLDDCIMINSKQHSWSTLQMIYSKADLHMPQYEAMRNLIERNSDIQPTVVVRAMTTTYTTSAIANGKLKVGDTRVGMQMLNAARQVRTTMGKKAGVSVIDAFRLMLKEGAQADLLVDSIEKNGKEYKRANFGHAESAYAVFTEMYNKNRSSNRVDFKGYQYIAKRTKI